MVTESMTDIVRRRGNRLARALRRLDVDSSRPVLVACCNEHQVDRWVALRAGAELHAATVVIDPDSAAWPDDDATGGVLLACAEGLTSAPRPFRGLVIGDAPGVLWWKVLELREASSDRHPRKSTLALTA